MMEVTGFDELERNLRSIAKSVPREAGAALVSEAGVEMKEMQRRTPIESGALRDSFAVSRAEESGDAISVRITAGGPSAPYGAAVHEDLEAHHPRGRAKFMESTLLESRVSLLGRLARRFDLRRLLR